MERKSAACLVERDFCIRVEPPLWARLGSGGPWSTLTAGTEEVKGVSGLFDYGRIDKAPSLPEMTISAFTAWLKQSL